MALSEHLEKLRYFFALTQHRSINETANALGISQAGLSKSLSGLEQVLGTQLFERSSNGLRLTKEGELLLSATKLILDESLKVDKALRVLKSASFPKVFRIGLYDSIAVYLFKSLSSYLLEIYPGMEMELTVDSSKVLAGLVEKSYLDLAIGVNFKDEKKPKAEYFELFKDEYSFYISSSIELTSRLPIFYHPKASDASGRTLEDYLMKIKDRRRNRIFNFETLKILVSQGMGIGILPTQVAKPLLSQKIVKQIEIQKFRKQFGEHEVGFLSTRDLVQSHREFLNDIYRLGQAWTTT